MKPGERTEMVFEAYLANPDADVAIIAKTAKISASACHYHLNKLHKKGRIVWNRERSYTFHMPAEEISKIRKASASKRTDRRSKGHAKRKKTLNERGLVSLPRLSKKRQAELIEQVVAKALQKAGKQKAGSGDDPIRVIRYPKGRFTGLKARKF